MVKCVLRLPTEGRMLVSQRSTWGWLQKRAHMVAQAAVFFRGDGVVDSHPPAWVELTDTALVARVVSNSVYRTLDLSFGRLFCLVLPLLAPQGV